MPTSLAQWERERFKYGDAAGDGKGDLLRMHGIKAEHSMNLLFSWLTANRSEVRLLDSLPIERGGTGASTVTGLLKNIGYFEDTNHTLRRGVKVLSVANTGTIDRFSNLPEVTFRKVSTGTYELKGFVNTSILFGLVFPVNNLNQVTHMAELAELEDHTGYTLKVHLADYTNPIPVLGALVDIPLSKYIDIECQ